MDIKQLNSFFDEIKPILENLQQSVNELPAALLQFCISKPFIDKVIFGVNTFEQLSDNIKKLSASYELPINNKQINESILIPSKWPK